MKKLCIVILSYNTAPLLERCLRSLEKVRDEVPCDIIVSDNGSTDGSAELVREKFPQIALIANATNLGFARGNNVAKPLVKSQYVLFLNSDTEVGAGVLRATTKYLDEHAGVGALTCKLVLADGSLDKDARRSFPTPWVSLTHLVFRLDQLFPKSALFARYWYGYKSPDETHEVEVLQGAFFLTRAQLLNRVGWFDEDYFLDGEDVDLSWKIHHAGYKLVYYPEVSVLHLKGASKGKNRTTRGLVGRFKRLKYRLAGVNSMEIFYKKRLWSAYPLGVNLVVLIGIQTIKIVRGLAIFLS